MNNSEIALVAMTALESVHGFSSTMPSYFTIKTFARSGDGSQEQHMSDLRSGYLPAIGLSLALGYLVSIILGNFYPLLACAVISAIMVAIYEAAIRGIA